MARQQRVSLFGQLRPTGVDPSAGANLRALAGLSEQVGDIAFGVGAKLAEKEGRLEGEAAVQRDEEGRIIPPELKSDLTIKGQAFNKAALLANRAQVGIDTKKALDRIQNENKLDPVKFENAANAFKAGTLQGMPEELANIVSRDIDSSVSSRFGQLQQDLFRREEAKQRAVIAEGIETATDDILNATRSGDTERQQQLIIEQQAALNEAVDAGLIDPTRAEQIQEGVRERVQEQEALGQIDRIIFDENLTIDQQINKGVNFVDELRTRETKDLSPEQKDSLVNVVQSKIADLIQRRNMNQKNRDIEMEKIISDLKVKAGMAEEQAKDGNFVDLASLTEQTESLHNRGLISESERTSLMTDFAQTRQEIERITLADKRIVARMSGEPGIDMNQKDIDSFWRRNVQDSLVDLPPEVANVATSNFILSTHTVPTQVRNQISNNILSGDPELIKQSADIIDRIDNVPGIVDLAVNANQRAFVDNVINLSENMDPAEAVRVSRELTDPRDKARVEAREEEIKSEKMRDDYVGIVEGAFDQFVGSDLATNINKERVTAEYASNFEAFYKAGMGKDRAEEKSIELLKRNWKDSEFGFMRNPPETYYSVGGNTEYIRDQLSRDINENFVGINFAKEDIFLLSDETTDRQAAQGKPTYRVMVIDENGELQMLNQRWNPDVQKESERQTAENIKKAEGIRERATERQDKLSTSDFLPSLGGL